MLLAWHDDDDDDDDDDKSNSDQKEQYPKFTVLQSKELPLTKLLPFNINKIISSIITPILVKNLKKMKPSSQVFFLQNIPKI